MSARIARGSGPRRGARPKQAPRGGKGRGRKAAPDPMPETVRRLSWLLFLGILVALAVAAIAMLRLPQMVGSTVGEAVGEAGFAVKRVEIKGANRVPKLQIYNVAFDQPSTAMPLVDLEGTRQRLLQFGWVRDARVSRRLPDTLVVEVAERQPAAIWQHNRRLALIDQEGVVLEAVRLEAMPDLPLVIGPAANRQAAGLTRLLDGVPHLKPMMEGATWVGGRRWDIRFQSGETLALPEGEDAAARALAHFARIDQSAQLLGRGFSRFDMRLPGKFVVRVTDRPGTSVPELVPEPEPVPAGGPVDATKTI